MAADLWSSSTRSRSRIVEQDMKASGVLEGFEMAMAFNMLPLPPD